MSLQICITLWNGPENGRVIPPYEIQDSFATKNPFCDHSNLTAPINNTEDNRLDLVYLVVKAYWGRKSLGMFLVNETGYSAEPKWLCQ